MDPSESLAVALNAMFAGAVKLVPFAGVVSATVGTALGPFTVIAKEAEPECPFVSVAVAVTE